MVLVPLRLMTTTSQGAEERSTPNNRDLEALDKTARRAERATRVICLLAGCGVLYIKWLGSCLMAYFCAFVCWRLVALNS